MSYMGYTTYEGYRMDRTEVNGLSLSYAVEGEPEGLPVVLLHGNGGSHRDLETTHHQLAEAGYRVYALDSRGQGDNPCLKEYHYKDMAEDTYQFIRRMCPVERPFVFGWSDGGIVALQMELLHPGTCAKIAVSGSNIFPEGVLQNVYQDMLSMGPDFPPLVRMMVEEPDMTMEDMRGIGCPALVICGEWDLIKRQHTEDIARNIPQGSVYIVPGADHGSHIVGSRQVGDILLGFFK